MADEPGNFEITGAHESDQDSHVGVTDQVQIVVTQAYGPTGEKLVGVSDVTFDGHPAVTLLVRTPDGREGPVHLSPIHGDDRKSGFTDIPQGTRLELLCPVTKKPLDRVGDIEGELDAGYYAIYLTPQLDRGSVVMVSDIWGHYHSRIVDNFELISAWAHQHADLTPGPE